MKSQPCYLSLFSLYSKGGFVKKLAFRSQALYQEKIMKLVHRMTGLLAFGLLTVACNTPTPPPTPSFSLKPAETIVEIPVGGEATSFVALERQKGFNNVVEMSFENLPAGFEQEWTRDTGNGDCGIRLKIGKNVAPGTYPLKVRGVAIDGIPGKSLNAQAAATTVTTTFNVFVPGLTAIRYTLTASPNVFSAEPGFTAKFAINIKEIDPNFNGNVQLTLENLPLGVSAVFAKNPVPTVNPPNQNTSLVTLNVASSTLPGVYAMKMVGVANGISRNTVVQLTVEPATTVGFKLSTSGVATPILQEERSNFTVNIERKAGFTAPVVLTAQGLPQDMRITTGTSNNISILTTMVAGFNTPSGLQNFTVKVTGGGITQTIPVETSVLSRFEQPKNTNFGDNALDSSFTNLPLGGFKTTPSGIGNVSLVQPDGKILVTNGLLGLKRLNADGTLDGTFSGVLNFVSVNRLLLQADNKILVLSDRAITRLNPDGSADSSFGTNGTTQIVSGAIGGGSILSLAQVDLGRFLFITQTELVRLTPGGNLDPDFDGDGRKTITIPNVRSTDPAVALTDSSGRFIVITDSNPGQQPSINLTRILQNGTVDSTYQSRPISNAALDLAFTTSRNRVTLDSQDRLLLLIRDVTTELYSVVRLSNDGSLDTSFDTDGRIDVTFNANLHVPKAITVLANNKIIMVGAANTNDFAAVRLNQDGSLDTSFGLGGKMLLGYTNPSNSLSFDSVFTGLIGLADSSAMAFGTGFGFGTNNDPFAFIAKFKP